MSSGYWLVVFFVLVCSPLAALPLQEAYAEYAAGGWQGMTVPEAYGGMDLPLSLGLIKSEMVGTANWSWGSKLSSKSGRGEITSRKFCLAFWAGTLFCIG